MVYTGLYNQIQIILLPILTLREVPRLSMSENVAVQRMLGYEIMGEWRNLFKEKLNICDLSHMLLG